MKNSNIFYSLFLLCAVHNSVAQNIARTKDFNKNTHKPNDIILTSEVIKFVDGASYGIDGNSVGLMLQIRNFSKLMLYGQCDTQGNPVGLFEFENKLYTVIDLCELEQQLTQEKNIKKLGSLATCLKKAKTVFSKKVEPFMETARGAKDPIIQLISEFCHKTHRKHSQLPAWAKIRDGKETEHFDVTTQSFNDLRLFLEDLIDFMTSLIKSCPKAQEQFKQKIK